jgi:hypothetical protein
MVAISGLWMGAAQPRSFPDRTKPIKGVDVEFDGGDFGGNLFRFRLIDPTLIESLIARLRQECERDTPPVPAYVVFGTIRVNYDDGTTEGAYLIFCRGAVGRGRWRLPQIRLVITAK